VRSVVVLALALSLGGCGYLDRMLAAGPSSGSNQVYLGRLDVIHVARRDTYRYACLNGPMLCEERGIDFTCRCP
jgi:hypothetical protein